MFIDDDEGTDDALLTHQTLIDTQERLGALLDLMPTGLVIHQMQGILYANQQALHLFEHNIDSIIGQHLLDHVNDDKREHCNELFMSTFLSDDPVRFPDFQFITKSGETRHIRATAGRLPWEGTPVVQVLLEDITELKIQAEELRMLTFHDVLTGAYNRRYFVKFAEERIQLALQEGQPFSLLVFDVDWFKQVNDTYGHLAGDEALKSIITAWNKNTRHNTKDERGDDGTLARIGGEEFAIFLPNCDLDIACLVAERVRKSIEDQIIEFEDKKFNLTASFGVTALQTDDTCLDDLIRRADAALYRAKENGRNRVEAS